MKNIIHYTTSTFASKTFQSAECIKLSQYLICLMWAYMSCLKRLLFNKILQVDYYTSLLFESTNTESYFMQGDVQSLVADASWRLLVHQTETEKNKNMNDRIREERRRRRYRRKRAENALLASREKFARERGKSQSGRSLMPIDIATWFA